MGTPVARLPVGLADGHSILMRVGAPDRKGTEVGSFVGVRLGEAVNRFSRVGDSVGMTDGHSVLLCEGEPDRKGAEVGSSDITFVGARLGEAVHCDSSIVGTLVGKVVGKLVGDAQFVGLAVGTASSFVLPVDGDAVAMRLGDSVRKYDVGF